MVCIRCKMVVNEELAKLGLHYTRIELGEVEVLENMSAEQRDQLRTALLKSGLELMDNKKKYNHPEDQNSYNRIGSLFERTIDNKIL